MRSWVVWNRVTRDKSFSNLVPYQFVTTYMGGRKVQASIYEGEPRRKPATDRAPSYTNAKGEGKSNLDAMSATPGSLLVLRLAEKRVHQIHGRSHWSTNNGLGKLRRVGFVFT